jgi:hypothetical protein
LMSPMSPLMSFGSAKLDIISLPQKQAPVMGGRMTSFME